MLLVRRVRPAIRLGLVLLAIGLLAGLPAPAVQAEEERPTRSPLADHLARQPSAFASLPDGTIDQLYGLPLDEARAVFFPVSRVRALPDDWTPPDLVYANGRPLRAIVSADLGAMLAAAQRDVAYPSVVSGYRSFAEQTIIYQNALLRQYYRADPAGLTETEKLAIRFVAEPGHSQHQLGTTADFSSWELGYGLRGTFGETAAGRWLAEHAWEYGFIQPYTPAAEARTGYGTEPWHYRWVGRPLAAVLWRDGYRDSGNPTADDAMLALEELLNWLAPELPTR